MKARDLAYETGSALLANRMRTLLTILGIVIGIAAVIALTSLIDGMRAAIVGQLGLNAARTVEITCWPPNNRQLTEADVETMARDLALLTKKGYRAEGFTPVDMFPHSAHCEVVGSLVRVKYSSLRF